MGTDNAPENMSSMLLNVPISPVKTLSLGALPNANKSASTIGSPTDSVYAASTIVSPTDSFYVSITTFLLVSVRYINLNTARWSFDVETRGIQSTTHGCENGALPCSFVHSMGSLVRLINPPKILLVDRHP